MATRSCREKAQKLNEQHQLILSKLLREEDNKYCADCEAKGPRWASWNIGVFICIRCAGIHRNLGVHISRVKSVNLDQWTPEQIQCMQDMGNTKARLLYEANLPENFRRPQTDQAVEFFIRDKYEKKKYYDKNAIAITNKEKEKKKEEKKKEKEPEKPVKPLTTEKLQKKEDQQLEPKKSTSPKKAAEPTVDLLGLDGPAEAPVTNGNTTTVPSLNDDLDIFGPMISNPLPATVIPPAQGTPSIPAAATLSTVISGDLDLFTEQATKSEEVAKKQLSKDSILSLYGTGTIQQQSTPGVFMGPTNIPFTSQAPTAFQGFPSMGVPVPAPAPAAPGLLGNVMGQSASMMVGMPMPNGFMGNAQTGVMPLPPNVVGPQGGMVGQMGAPQSKFGLPQAQQPQWNLSQMNQQMAGMSISSTNPTVGFGQPPNTTAGWSGSSSGQTLSTQLWK
ncbi:stromal membrane-associated protein 1 isoform X5 [Canis lupus dingo]|uniref:Small ArfGAP 1 n=2 Tax=Canis lupus familiaris TaxID=9615 RepID=A0A8C0QG44_CANLF|nr:stromal membrane-associated protein 1 isoform X5 [Canis lupus dingo]XP_038538574.1 stromal membrane-associated protein 1 isoform X2 [Canis lupus familiaris]ABL61516.1 SMAP1 protein [Canis lupus familiaris]|eukprot:XP_005627065.1 stromal membrane-associated protein 1 isoform X3 [Canis lupus familiaris]